jgi:hypothetical protein
MATTHTSKSRAVRARLNHPVIDSDGHTVEFEPGFVDALKEVGGASLVDRYRARKADTENGLIRGFFSWYQQSPEERRDQRTSRPPWWALPTKNTLDRATATLPKLLYERLDDIGLDFTVLYPTLGLLFPHINDEELRRGGCRAMNTFHANIFREYSDRMVPVAVIPMHTPQEAIEELEYAVKTLGFKAVMMAGHGAAQIALPPVLLFGFNLSRALCSGQGVFLRCDGVVTVSREATQRAAELFSRQNQ